MKRCNTCYTTDPLAFTPSRNTVCKPCASAVHKAWYLKNKEKHLANCKTYAQTNPDKIAINNKKWKDKNTGKVNATTAKRRATKLQQTPSWSETEEIKELYSWAAHLQKVTGIQMHVDHVIPLQGKHVSGLHCVDNLKVITAAENLRKGNKHAGH